MGWMCDIRDVVTKYEQAKDLNIGGNFETYIILKQTETMVFK